MFSNSVSILKGDVQAILVGVSMAACAGGASGEFQRGFDAAVNTIAAALGLDPVVVKNPPVSYG